MWYGNGKMNKKKISNKMRKTETISYIIQFNGTLAFWDKRGEQTKKHQDIEMNEHNYAFSYAMSFWKRKWIISKESNKIFF